MEVTGRQPTRPHPASERFREVQAEFTEAQREKVRRARELLASSAEQRIHEHRAERAQERAETRRREISELEHSREQRMRESDARRHQDNVQLSHAAQAVRAEPDAAQAERVERLKAEHAAGTLADPERIARAASSLLAGSSDA